MQALTNQRPLLVFDLDDTLIASFPGYVTLHQRVATDLGWDVPSRDDLVAYADTWETTLQRLWPDRSLEPFFRRFEEIVDDHPYPPIPGVSEALASLRAQGFSLWIVTKRTRRRLRQRMEGANLDAALFDGIFTQDDQPAPKPDPRCFEPIWERLGHRPPALYIGDRHEDQLAAHGARLSFVAVRTGPEAAHDWFDGLDHRDVLHSAAALPDWLAEHSERILCRVE